VSVVINNDNIGIVYIMGASAAMIETGNSSKKKGRFFWQTQIFYLFYVRSGGVLLATYYSTVDVVPHREEILLFPVDRLKAPPTPDFVIIANTFGSIRRARKNGRPWKDRLGLLRRKAINQDIYQDSWENLSKKVEARTGTCLAI
jgi:hypothetical protein